MTILVDERADGVQSVLRPDASLIAPDGSEAALLVARDLDAKIERLLEAAARGQTEDAETSDARRSSGEVQELGRTDDRLIGEREHGKR